MSDKDQLIDYWHRETNYLNDKVDESFKNAQDHAYQLGLARGKEQRDKLMAALKQAKALAPLGSVIREASEALIAGIEATK